MQELTSPVAQATVDIETQVWEASTYPWQARQPEALAETELAYLAYSVRLSVTTHC